MFKEAALQKRVRLQYAEMGILLWRNNVGACVDERGNYIRYGLANESKQMNRRIKSSDLIGINPIVITNAMVGLTIGQFIALECKHPGWIYKGVDQEMAQQNYINLVKSKGGYATFITGLGQCLTSD